MFPLTPMINVCCIARNLEQCEGSVELLDSRAKQVNKTEDFHSLRDGYLTSLKPYPKRLLGSCAALASAMSTLLHS